MTKLSDALEDLADVWAIEVADAHVVVEWQDFPGCRVGIDAAGNAVRVEFDGPRWGAEAME